MRKKQIKYSKLFKVLFVVVLCSLSFSNIEAQVTLSTDFTSDTDKKEPLHDIWTVANRISPTNGSNIRSGTDINLVRMIGGILKTVDGKKVPNLDYDPCLYDSVNNVYVYRWEPLLDRLGKIVNGQTKLHQLVLDQPPWAFQHGYEFIPEGTTDNVHFREDERVTIYGNSLPPKDKVAYYNFIKAMMEKLIETYGIEEVSSWRFRVGSEIETPDHWPGTAQDFVEHFANTEKAVRAVLPNAIIGVHTRTPGFIYKNGTPKNYKGLPYASFANDIIEYSHDNNVRYDFWGISDYVLINGEKYRDISTKYDSYFKALQEHPKWNQNATLDMMEYSTVITMDAADGKGFLNCASSHKDIIELGLSHMFYRKGIDKIFRWGLRDGDDEGPIKELRQMVGLTRYETKIAGSTTVTGNELDAIYAKNTAGDKYDVIVYNYNAKSLNHAAAEQAVISFATDLPVGSRLFFRNNAFGIEQNKLEQFLLKEGKSWLKAGWDEKGSPERALTTEGYQKYEAFTDYKPLKFIDWKTVTTVARTDGGQGSMVVVNTDIPSFAYKKFEFRMESEFVTKIEPSKIQWATNTDFSAWKALSSKVQLITENDMLNLNYQDGAGWQFAGVDGLNIDSHLFGKLRILAKNTTDKANLQMAANAPGSTFLPGRLLVDLPNDGAFHTVEVDLSNWGLWTGTINDFKVYSNISGGSIVIDKLEFVSTSTEDVSVTVTQQGQGFLNYSSGTCLVGQQFTFKPIAEPGWIFAEWTGDVTATDNPLTVTVTKDMVINAVFKTYVSLTTNATNGTIIRNPSQDLYPEGTEVLLTAQPNSGYHFSHWSGDHTSTENPLTISLNANTDVTAHFESSAIYAINATAVNGSVVKLPNTAKYEKDDVVQLTATPAAGYRFTGWTGDKVSSEKVISVTVTSNMNLSANFELIPLFTLTVINDNGSVFVSPKKATYEEGEKVFLMNPTPDEGYEFTGWSGDASGNDAPLALTMNADMTITANFSILNSVVNTQSNDVSIYPNPSTGNFRISTGTADKGIVTVYTIGGKLVQTKSIEGTTTLSIQQKGMYFIQVNTSKGITQHKVIIQ